MNDYKKAYYESLALIDEYYRNEYGSSYGPDGIVGGEKGVDYYFAGYPRIMVVLKEGSVSDKWYPREMEKLAITEDNLETRWTAYILRTIEYVRGRSYPLGQKMDFHPGVYGFSYFNLKKNDEGVRNTDDYDLEKAVKRDSDMLWNQFRASIPDIVFCCGKCVYSSLSKYVLARDGVRELPGIYKLGKGSMPVLHVFQYVDGFGVERFVWIIDGWAHYSRTHFSYEPLYSALANAMDICNEWKRFRYDIRNPFFLYDKDSYERRIVIKLGL